MRALTGSPRAAYRLLGLATSAVVIALVAGCVVGGSSDPAPQASRQAVVEDTTTTAAAPPTMEAAAPDTPEKLTPGQLALKLPSLLGQHTVLAADMMRGRLRNDPDLAQAANSALGKNTADMSSLIAGAFGQDAADKFAPMWSNHVTALFNYARGLADGDAAVQGSAKVTIARFEKSLADFFVAASQGRLPHAAAVGAVDAHIQHLLAQADAYARKQYAESDKQFRLGFAHGFELGKALSSTLLPPAQAKVLDEPLWRLSSALEKLLGEHVVLVVATMRAGVTDAPDFATAAASMNANTTDLAGAMGVLFGQPIARSFQAMWADHVDLLVRYAGAIAKGDDAAKSSITSELNGFEREMSAFLNTATKDKLTASALAKALQSHDTMLRQQVDAFVAKDYHTSHDLAYSTYQEMYGLASQLADAFGVTVANKLPHGGAETGRGGAAAAVGGS